MYFDHYNAQPSVRKTKSLGFLLYVKSLKKSLSKLFMLLQWYMEGLQKNHLIVHYHDFTINNLSACTRRTNLWSSKGQWNLLFEPKWSSFFQIPKEIRALTSFKSLLTVQDTWQATGEWRHIPHGASAVSAFDDRACHAQTTPTYCRLRLTQWRGSMASLPC